MSTCEVYTASHGWVSVFPDLTLSQTVTKMFNAVEYADFPSSTQVNDIIQTCTDKKKTKFSSYIRNFRWDWVQIYEEGLPKMGGNAQIFHHICGGRSLSISLYMRKILFSLFYQCTNMTFFVKYILLQIIWVSTYAEFCADSRTVEEDCEKCSFKKLPTAKKRI